MVPPNVKSSHGLSLNINVDRITRFVHDTGLITNVSDLNYFESILSASKTNSNIIAWAPPL